MRENPLCAQTAFTAIYHRYYTMYSIYTTDNVLEKLSVGMTIQSRKNGPKTRPRKKHAVGRLLSMFTARYGRDCFPNIKTTL